MEQTTTVGIDLAKEVFAICMLDRRGAVRRTRACSSEHNAPLARTSGHFNA
jgi:hypothetical protein